MSEDKAKALGYEPLGFIVDYAYAAVDPNWQLLMGPSFATPKALRKAGLTLEDIDVAFVCMNLPFTMSGPEAAAMVREFAPRVIYPYHYRNQGGSFTDLDAFKQTVGTDRGVEVRIRDWY